MPMVSALAAMRSKVTVRPRFLASLRSGDTGRAIQFFQQPGSAEMNDGCIKDLVIHARGHVKMIGSAAHVKGRPVAIGAHIQNRGRGRNALEALHGCWCRCRACSE